MYEFERVRVLALLSEVVAPPAMVGPFERLVGLAVSFAANPVDEGVELYGLLRTFAELVATSPKDRWANPGKIGDARKAFEESVRKKPLWQAVFMFPFAGLDLASRVYLKALADLVDASNGDNDRLLGRLRWIAARVPAEGVRAELMGILQKGVAIPLDDVLEVDVPGEPAVEQPAAIEGEPKRPEEPVTEPAAGLQAPEGQLPAALDEDRQGGAVVAAVVLDE